MHTDPLNPMPPRDDAAIASPSGEPAEPNPASPSTQSTTTGRRIWLDDHPSSRELVLGWCFWLLGSWAISLTIESRVPAVRWMVFAAMTGMMLLWPALRLSQDAFTRRRRFLRYAPDPIAHGQADPFTASTCAGDPNDAAPAPQVVSRTVRSRIRPALVFRDWLSMNLIFQAVIWPLRFTSHWNVQQTLWLDGAVASWSLLAGALVAWGCQSSRALFRSLSMLLVLLLVFAEPVVQAVAGYGAMTGNWSMIDWPMRISPIETLYALTEVPVRYSVQPWATHVLAMAVAAVLAWGFVFLASGVRSHPVEAPAR